MPTPLPSHPSLQWILHCKTDEELKTTFRLEIKWKTIIEKKPVSFIIENAKIILLMVSLIGALGGATSLVIANPPTNFFYLLPFFALIGIILSNLILIILIQASKELKD